jgi:hypothetical protein
MPVINSKFISSWYYATSVADTNTEILCQKISTEQSHQVQESILLQGNAGVHVITPAGDNWTMQLDSPCVVFGDYTDTNTSKNIIDIFGYLVIKHEQIMKHINSNVSLTRRDLINKLQVNINNTVSASATFYGEATDYFVLNKVSPTNLGKDFVARAVKFYDTSFYIDGHTFMIESGSINVAYNYKPAYLINSGTKEPFYSFQNYAVSGELTIVLDPANWPVNTIVTQEINQLFAEYANVSIGIGNKYLSLGQIGLLDTITFTLDSNNLVKANIKFKEYARYTTI